MFLFIYFNFIIYPKNTVQINYIKESYEGPQKKQFPTLGGGWRAEMLLAFDAAVPKSLSLPEENSFCV